MSSIGVLNPRHPPTATSPRIWPWLSRLSRSYSTNLRRTRSRICSTRSLACLKVLPISGSGPCTARFLSFLTLSSSSSVGDEKTPRRRRVFRACPKVKTCSSYRRAWATSDCSSSVQAATNAPNASGSTSSAAPIVISIDEHRLLIESPAGKSSLSLTRESPGPQNARRVGISNWAINLRLKSSSSLSSYSVVISAVPARYPSWKYGRKAAGGQMLRRRIKTRSCSEFELIRFVMYGSPKTYTNPLRRPSILWAKEQATRIDWVRSISGVGQTW